MAIWLMKWGRWCSALSLCILASHCWAQEQPLGTREQKPGEQQTRDQLAPPEPSTTFPTPGPTLVEFPVELYGLLRPMRQGATLTPAFGISEEYNDNIFADNRDKQSDFITNFSPAVTLTLNWPRYELRAGYIATGQVYARETRLTSLLESQTFIGTGLYRATPNLTLTVAESFVWDRGTEIVGGFSTGRQEFLTNTITPGLSWSLTPADSLSASAGYSTVRFLESGPGRGSDTYSAQGTFSHQFTPRFNGHISYFFTYIDPESDLHSITHQPLLGFSYRITPALTLAVEGGPAFSEIGGDSFVLPTGSIDITQRWQSVLLNLRYSRGVSAAGAFAGSNDTQTASGALGVTTLQRGLFLYVSPWYSKANSLDNRAVQQVDVNSWGVYLGATYEINRYMSLIGRYSFFQQRTGKSSAVQVDIDQNRVRIGLQFGYPIPLN